MKYLSECDLLVYDLHNGNPRDVDLALAGIAVSFVSKLTYIAFKKYDIQEEKVLILISSLMAWNATPPNLKEIKEGKEADEEDAPEGDEPELD
jgi:hypothetical protein